MSLLCLTSLMMYNKNHFNNNSVHIIVESAGQYVRTFCIMLNKNLLPENRL